MFKLSVLVLVICSVSHVFSLSEEMLELANMLHQNCQGETGVPEDLILKARTGDFADDNTLKCYMKCLMTQMAVMDEDDGMIDQEAMIAVMPDEFKELATKVISTCGTKVGADACDNAWLTNKCYYQEAPNNYFLP